MNKAGPVDASNTCDLCDTHKGDTSGAFRVLPGVFHSYGGRLAFAGPVRTVRCFEDNSLVKAAVESSGLVATPRGDRAAVLVVAGGASLRRALVGGKLAAAAAQNGWAGIVVDGAVRDVAELQATALGVRALGLCPLPTDKRNEGAAGVPVQVQGQWLRPDDWLVADADGMVVLAAQP
jgi:regulator of ribonuclease activity A